MLLDCAALNASCRMQGRQVACVLSPMGRVLHLGRMQHGLSCLCNAQEGVTWQDCCQVEAQQPVGHELSDELLQDVAALARLLQDPQSGVLLLLCQDYCCSSRVGTCAVLCTELHRFLQCTQACCNSLARGSVDLASFSHSARRQRSVTVSRQRSSPQQVA